VSDLLSDPDASRWPPQHHQSNIFKWHVRSQADSKVYAECPTAFYFTLNFLLPRVQAFLNQMTEKWSPESLTIGPLSRTTDRFFWHDAFQNFQAVPHLKELTIVYDYPNAEAFDLSCWAYFNSLFCQTDIFPPSMWIDVRASIRSLPLSSKRRQALQETLSLPRIRRRLLFWGRRE
jgi:hypothetical protein